MIIHQNYIETFMEKSNGAKSATFSQMFIHIKK